MVIDRPGKVTERIMLLGRRESCVYLLKGDGEYSLLGGGMVHIVPDVIDQLEAFGIRETEVRRMMILHSHFDHCGIIPYFKKRWPWAKVTTSERAQTLLSTPKVISSIQDLNVMLLAKYGREKEAEALGLSFEGIRVERVVKDGDVLPCGDLSMKILEVPGHSSCSIAVYVPEEKALFASDAGGIPFGNRIFTAANSDFDQYIKSLQKMSAYEVDVFLPEHYGARTGGAARFFIRDAVVAAAAVRRMLETSFEKTRDIHESTQEITDRLMADAPKDFLPREIIALVVGQMVNQIAKRKTA